MRGPRRARALPLALSQREREPEPPLPLDDGEGEREACAITPPPPVPPLHCSAMERGLGGEVGGAGGLRRPADVVLPEVELDVAEELELETGVMSDDGFVVDGLHLVGA